MSSLCLSVRCDAGDPDKARRADPFLSIDLQWQASVRCHGGALRQVAEQRAIKLSVDVGFYDGERP